jgi:hypothetical protein
VEWSDLGQLKMLDAAISEGMRLFPATSSGPMREAKEDTVIDGRVVPKVRQWKKTPLIFSCHVLTMFMFMFFLALHCFAALPLRL